MKTVAVTGLSGVVGKVLIEELSRTFKIIDLFHETKYLGNAKIYKHIKMDLLNKKMVANALTKAEPDVVIHLAAITHIDKCEKDRKNEKEGIVWKTNVEGTKEIAKFCAKHKIQIVFLSTECVFDGKQKYFSENSKKNPINWYGFTKSEAEEVILTSGAPATIIRSVVAYHRNDHAKTIYGKILKELKSGNKIQAVSDQFFTPTHTPDIAKAINIVVENRHLGVFHVVPEKNLTPYDLAVIIAKANKYSPRLVRKIKLQSFYGKEKAALRLRNASLLGRKSNKVLKINPKNPEEALQSLWMNHLSLL